MDYLTPAIVLTCAVALAGCSPAKCDHAAEHHKWLKEHDEWLASQAQYASSLSSNLIFTMRTTVNAIDEIDRRLNKLEARKP